MVPPPFGWGVVTNPVDRVIAKVSQGEAQVLLEIRDEEGEAADIPSMVTLHVVLPDAPQLSIPPTPEQEKPVDTIAELARRRGFAGDTDVAGSH